MWDKFWALKLFLIDKFIQPKYELEELVKLVDGNLSEDEQVSWNISKIYVKF